MKPNPTHTVTLHVERDTGTGQFEQEIAVKVTFEIEAGERGHRDRWGAPETPDVPASAEIIDVKPDTIVLTPAEKDKAESRMWEELAEKMKGREA